MAKIKRHLKDIEKGAKGLLEEGKKAVYGAASKIEKTVINGGGFIDDAKDLAGKVAGEARDFHEGVKKKGGYGKAAKKLGSQIVGAAKDFYEDTGEVYDNFKDTFYDKNGKFDSEKAKEVLKNETEAVKRFGGRSVKYISELVMASAKSAEKGMKAFGKDYRSHIPSREERAGIGSEYHGVITREHLNDCVKYEKKVRSQLPGGLKVRKQILDDLRTHAVTNKKDLTEIYDKGKVLDAVNKYIK